MKLLAAIAPTACALLTGLVIALGSSSALASPAASASLAKAADACDKCGPAPCCTILWATFCGCPWGDTPEERLSSRMEDDASFEDVDESLACVEPEPAPMCG